MHRAVKLYKYWCISTRSLNKRLSAAHSRQSVYKYPGLAPAPCDTTQWVPGNCLGGRRTDIGLYTVLVSCRTSPIVRRLSVRLSVRRPGRRRLEPGLHPVRWTWYGRQQVSGSWMSVKTARQLRTCGCCAWSRWRRDKLLSVVTTNEYWNNYCTSTTATSSRPTRTSTAT